jgi:hypothetical protein
MTWNRHNRYIPNRRKDFGHPYSPVTTAGDGERNSAKPFGREGFVTFVTASSTATGEGGIRTLRTGYPFATALLRESGGKDPCDGHRDVDKKCKKSDKF